MCVCVCVCARACACTHTQSFPHLLLPAFCPALLAPYHALPPQPSPACPLPCPSHPNALILVLQELEEQRYQVWQHPRQLQHNQLRNHGAAGHQLAYRQ